MKITLNEIWNFLELMDKREIGWDYSLRAGKIVIEGISTTTMLGLKNDENYDTELVPSLFTFREILWQPDIFNEASMSLPPLRILKAHCNESVEELQAVENNVNQVYSGLIDGLGKCCESAIKDLQNDRADVKKILGNLRTIAFPIIKFFIYHPKNRRDIFNDAINRLNYAVKIMLTQFYGQYTELSEPFWEVTFLETKKKTRAKKELITE